MSIITLGEEVWGQSGAGAPTWRPVVMGKNGMVGIKLWTAVRASDPRVKAVVLRLNSPGGAVMASDIMYEDVLRFRRATHKPVVACMMDVAASGGYYLAMSADRVYAHPTTVTGSIGVIMSLYNASGLFQMVGLTRQHLEANRAGTFALEQHFRKQPSVFAKFNPDPKSSPQLVVPKNVAEVFMH